MSNVEKQPTGPDKIVEAPRVSDEHYERLEKSGERGQETKIESAEKSAEKARVEALESAVSVESGSAERNRAIKGESKSAKRRGVITKKEREDSFKRRMSQVQADMPPVQRVFSKFIHAKPVEKASELIGSTIARPNAILSGAITAFILVLIVYIVAKSLGYVLSGFETIGAFIAGWILGIIYDYLRIMLTGKKS